MDDGTISKSDDFAAAWDAPQKGALDQAELDRLTDELVTALKTVFDPEIPVDIDELGLIYRVDINDDRDVVIDMTLTAPGCPVAGEMPGWVEDAVRKVEGVRSATARLVFDPPWDPSKMSDEAKLALNMFGPWTSRPPRRAAANGPRS